MSSSPLFITLTRNSDYQYDYTDLKIKIDVNVHEILSLEEQYERHTIQTKAEKTVKVKVWFGLRMDKVKVIEKGEYKTEYRPVGTLVMYKNRDGFIAQESHSDIRVMIRLANDEKYN